MYLGLVGLVLSLYALWVEHRARHGEKVLCDFHELISCTKAFLSPYGRIFGLHNAWFGVGLYIIIITFHTRPDIVWPLALVASVLSLYLAFVSYVTMRNFCLVCTAIYLVNFAISYVSWPAGF